ncbi:UNVERIFIED_CONTAM: hypothetical protein K2H54_007294 [Gekko kuhli]
MLPAQDPGPSDPKQELTSILGLEPTDGSVQDPIPITTAALEVRTPASTLGPKEVLRAPQLSSPDTEQESTQETYSLTQGPRWESLFHTGAFQGFGASETGEVTAGQAWITDRTKERKDYLLAEEEEEEDEVDQ